MLIRTRLIGQTVVLQLLSLVVLSYAFLTVDHKLDQRDIVRTERQIQTAVARAATDALIQKDQVQLLSYLNFMKEQYPAITYARTIWKNGDHAMAPMDLGKPAPSATVLEERVTVNDPANPSRSVQVLYGTDQDLLQEPMRMKRRRGLKIFALVLAPTLILSAGLAALLWQSLGGSLAALGRLAGQISEGRLGVSLEWGPNDEIGSLVGAFNHMSARLAELDAAKKAFISSVTHELRSPLGAIESFLPLIKDKALAGTDQARGQFLEYLDRVEANVQRLNRFINDLLDVAKIEQGKMECVVRKVELDPIIIEVVQFFEAKARLQKVEMENKLAGSIPVQADPDRIRQVMVNLLANSLKFTAAGGRVTLSSQKITDGDGSWLEIAVGDTGRGMDETDRRRLFQAFSQGRNIAEGVAGPKGTGLGLYIVKSIIDQHGGKLEVRSTPGQGTRIAFLLRTA